MEQTETATLPVESEKDRYLRVTAAGGVSHQPFYYAWLRMKRNRLAMVGLVVIVSLLFIALFAGVLAPHDPNAQIYEYEIKPPFFKGNVLVKRLESGDESGTATKMVPIKTFKVVGDKVEAVDFEDKPISIPLSELSGQSEKDWHQEPVFPMGTDKYARVIYGTRISLSVGVIATTIALIIGVSMGALAGFFRGKVDAVIMWVINVVWSFPELLLIIAMSVALGRGFWQVFLAVGLATWVDPARIVRGQFISLREREYVEATRALGYGNIRTIFKHILPNSLGPIIVIATADFAGAILSEAALSFLGVGVQPPTASWGSMLRDGYGYIVSGQGWWLSIFPGLSIMMAVLAFNLLGDGLRDALDPKLKR